MNKKLIVYTLLGCILSTQNLYSTQERALKPASDIEKQTIDTNSIKSTEQPIVIDKDKILLTFKKKLQKAISEKKLTRKEAKNILYTMHMQGQLTRKKLDAIIKELKLTSMLESSATKLRMLSAGLSGSILKYGGLILSGYGVYQTLPLFKYLYKASFNQIKARFNRSKSKVNFNRSKKIGVGMQIPFNLNIVIPLLSAAVSVSSFVASFSSITADFLDA